MFTFVPRTGPKIRIPGSFLTKLKLFKTHPELINRGRYEMKSNVNPNIVDLFFSRLLGAKDTEHVTEENAGQLMELCNELGFAGFDEILAGLGDEYSQTRRELASLRGHVNEHDVILADLQRQVFALQRQLLMQRVVSQQVAVLEKKLTDTATDLRKEIQDVSSQVQTMNREISGNTAELKQLGDELVFLKESHSRNEQVSRERLQRYDETLSRSRQTIMSTANEVQQLKRDMKASTDKLKSLSGDVSGLIQARTPLQTCPIPTKNHEDSVYDEDGLAVDAEQDRDMPEGKIHRHRFHYGKVEQVKLVSIWNPVTLGVQRIGPEMEKIDADLKALKHLNAIENTEVGQIVLVRRRISGVATLVRARICKVENSEISVKLLDYSEPCQIVRSVELYEIPRGIAKIEPQGRTVVLGCCEPYPDPDVCSQCIEELWKICRDAKLYLHLMYKDGKPNVLLTDQPPVNSGSLNRYLIVNGFLKFVDHPVFEDYTDIIRGFRQEKHVWPRSVHQSVVTSPEQRKMFLHW